MNRNPNAEQKKPREPEPDPARLDVLCRRHGVNLSTDQVDQLWTFHTLLRERNRELNMTRIHNFESMVVKHYVDSMLSKLWIRVMFSSRLRRRSSP